MKLRKEWYLIGTCICGAAALAGLFLTFLSIDFSSLFEYFPEVLRTGIEALAGTYGKNGTVIRFTGADVILGLFGGNEGIPFESAAISLRTGIRMMVMIPCFFLILSLGFSIVRREWAMFASLGSALAGAFLTVFLALIYFPSAFCKNVEEGAFSVIGSLADGSKGLLDIAGLLGAGQAADSLSYVREEMTGFGRRTVSRMIFHSLGPGWWIWLICFLAIVVTAVLAIPLCKDREKETTSESEGLDDEPSSEDPVPSRPASPSVYVKTGSMQGAMIVLEGSELLRIGRDPSICNLVMEDPGVEALHCTIRFDGRTKEYQVWDNSLSGITCEGLPLDKEKENILPGGLPICFGSGNIILFLGDI